MKRVVLLLTLLCLQLNGFSQTAATYGFSAFSAPYASISSTGTFATGVVGDDNTQTGVPIPFTFFFCGVGYNQLSISTNGWVSLNNSGVTDWQNIQGNIGGPGWLMVYWGDLYRNAGGCGGGSNAYYQTLGTAPNRIFVVEWNNFHEFGWGGACSCCLTNCQLKLYEGTNIIDFCYGASTTLMSPTRGAVIGIANSTTDWQNLNNVSASPTPSSTTWYGEPTAAITTAPARDQVYRWFPCPVSILPTSNSPVCLGGTLNLIGTTTGPAIGYSWTGPASYSSPLQNPSITGVTAAQAGTYTFTATDGTCSVTGTTAVSVTLPPASMPGTVAICSGSSITLSNSSPVGTWSSSNSSVASIVSTTGVLTGGASGTAVITYANSCGAATRTVTVNPLPLITGTMSMCPGYNTILSSSISGGTWSSATTTVATITPGGGMVFGVSSGTSIITYTTTSGCRDTAIVSVIAGPPTFTISPASSTLCSGYQRLIAPTIASSSITTTFPSTGSFVVPDNTPAGITNAINVAGIPASSTVVDVAVILNSVTMPRDGDLTFNIQAPNSNILNLVEREGGGGNNFTNTVVSSLGGTTFPASAAPFTGTYSADAVISTGPTAYQSNVTTWPPLYSVLNGNWLLCARDWVNNRTATVNNWSVRIHYNTPAGTYVWSPATGLYTNSTLTTPYVAGTPADTVYASPASTTVYTATASVPGLPCTTSSTATVNVTIASGSFTGSTSVCLGLTTTLSSASGPGTWTSSNTSVATVTPGPAGGGVVTGISAGTSVITYTNGCATTVTITVNPIPPPISGTPTLCVGGTTQLSNSVAGTWSAATTTVATITPGGGLAYGVSSGTSIITFTQSSTGCYNTGLVTVNDPPGPISGPTIVCTGSSIALTDPIAGGTWSSSSVPTASVSSSGVVTGGPSLGTVVISYTNSCGARTTTVTVVAPPGTISGATSMCSGNIITLSNPIPGGSWSSSAPPVASVTSAGVVTAGTAGIAVISYVTGCGSAATTTITVNSAPTNISGITSICLGGSTTLSNNGSPTGTWTSSNPSVATINTTTGAAGSGGVNPGNAVITASNICGSLTTTLTVLPAPAISGITTFCQNATTTLSSSLGVGTWSSSNPAVATTNSVGPTGVIYGTGIGSASGTAVITHITAAGCIATTTVTTTPAPTAITGLFSVCAGSVTNLTDGQTGGVWTSTVPVVGTVGTTGDVHGVTAGTTTISYTIGTCAASATITVNSLPGAITGPTSVCVGSNITLVDTPSTGFWISSNPGVATIDGGTGVVTGQSAGTSTITYQLLTGCYVTRSVTVNASPGPITGNTTLCVGQTSQLSDATGIGGGTWSSSATLVASVSPTAFITTLVPGTAVITHTVAGCSASTTITVNSLPSAIVGPTTICTGATGTLTVTPSGGTWSSSAPVIATIGSLTGVVTGGSLPGTTVITYSLASGCISTVTVTVNQTPTSISGNTTICAGTTTTLSDGVAGGIWTTSVSSVATVGSTSGVVTGGSGSGGNTIITYARAGCSVNTTVTVNPLPGPIVGATNVCVGSTTALTDMTAGGTWGSSNPGVAPVTSGGVVTGNIAGTTVITYTLPTGCIQTVTITVYPLPGAITGNTTICAGTITQLSNSSPGGTWSSGSLAVASVGSATGSVTGGGVSSTSTTTITYTLGTGCFTTTVVTVNPLPAAIAGATTICVGSSTTLSDATPGGTWNSGTLSVATVTPGPGAGGGVVYGVSAGTSRITYTLASTGCTNTVNVTVNPLPTTISGTMSVCVGATTQLSDGTSGGTWSSATPGVATVGLTSGTVGGVAAGTAVITYTVGSGCFITTTVTVNPSPATITGNTSVCAGSTTTLSDATPGGTWSSGTLSVATIGITTGIVSGVATGISRITYTLISTGCTATTMVTVNPLPSIITGPSSMCQGTTINLSDVTPGGTWSSSNSALATIAVGGTTLYADTVGGIVGIDTITYTLSTGCIQTKTVTINIQPYPITGGPVSICQHASASLSDATPGGAWSSTNVAIASVTSGGVVTGGNSTGTVNISYTIGSCGTATFASVNVQPGTITGNTLICYGNASTLSVSPSGGVWTSDNTVVAVIGGAGNVATGLPGMSTGTANISYTIGSCRSVTTVTVTPQPTSISGITSFCNHSTTTLSNGISGGTWSIANTSIATVDPVTGVVTGVNAGTTTATYTYGTCFAVRSITVNVQPGPILGNTSICNLSCTQLSDANAGGTWSIGLASLSVATISSTGVLCGTGAGTGVITYTIGSCASAATVTVNPLPSPITGSFYLCQGSTTSLGDLSPGGTWSSSNLSVATVGVTTGIVYGVSIGSSVITYTLPTGCTATQTVNVIPAPAPISGGSSVCVGSTISLSDATFGGTWTSSNPAVASIDPSTAVVTGNSAGTVVISYTLGSGCRVVKPVAVNPVSPITGTMSVCVGQTTMLSDSTVGGSWASLNSTIATVNITTGVVTGVAPGTAIIVYNLPAGCATITTVTVNALPPVIMGPSSVCVGQFIGLSDAAPGGVWSSSNPAVATIDPAGVVTGVSPGTTIISYFQGGCPQTKVITVSDPPAPITGNTNICMGSVGALSDATPGGAWSSSNTSVATIDPLSGFIFTVAPGNTTITYTAATGCTDAVLVTINPLPAPITGDTAVCVGSCTPLSDATPGGAWFINPMTIANINFINGTVCGISAGTAVVSYQIITGCYVTRSVTVNPLPPVITGGSSVCVNSTITLSSASGGSWSSSNSLVATVDPVTGMVTGVAPGTVTITYVSGTGTGCARSIIITVNPLPASITGNTNICMSMCTNLADADAGGTWTSANTYVVTVDPNTGVACAAAPIGATIITYTLPTGCYTTTSVNIVPPPMPITGPSEVCEGGSTISLSDVIAGGSWSSSNPSLATVDPSSGVVTGVSAGFVIITYTMGGGGCYVIHPVVVNPLPAPITGVTTICAGLTTNLFDATPGGVWSSSNLSVATIGATTGFVQSFIPGGTSIITYRLVLTGCAATTTLTVNPLPDTIRGNTNICIGGIRILSDVTPGGTWTSADPLIASVVTGGAGEGIVTGISYGAPSATVAVTTITYTLLSTGCIRSTTVAVHPLPAVHNVIGGGPYCAGAGGVHVKLDGSETGVQYLLYLGSTPVGVFPGTGDTLDFGLQVLAGTYTVIAINNFTTCSNTMTGSATVVITPTVTPTVAMSVSPNDTLCAGTSASFTTVITNGGAAPIYQWSVNGVNVSAASAYSFVPADGDVVVVAVTSSAICPVPAVVRDTITMTVFPTLFPSVGMTVSPNDTVCFGTPVTLTAVPSYGGSSPIFIWKVNGSTAGTGITHTYIPSDGDLVYVRMVSNYLCRLADTVSSYIEVIAVDTPVIPTVTIVASPASLISAGTTDTLTAIVTNGVNPTYQWFRNGVLIPGATSSTFISNSFSAPHDSVSCMVTNSTYCHEHTLGWIYIQTHPQGVSGVTVQMGDITVVPNPNKGTFTIKGSLGTISDEDVTIELTNMLGQVMYKDQVLAKNGKLDKQVQLEKTIANGMYMLNVKVGGTGKVFHLVIEQ